MPDVELAGCTPEPMMGYLKALGVFRLVAEQADQMATMSWQAGVCRLTSAFDRDSLTHFFLSEYQPTPVATPWNSASGFAPTKAENKAPKDKAAREALEAIARSTLPQLELYRRTISEIRRRPRGNEDEKTWKQQYFARCRAELPDAVVAWLDTCFALTNESLSSFPLLGSGGNDGVTDFGSLYMQRLVDALLSAQTQHVSTTSRDYLEESLFAGIDVGGMQSEARPPSLMQDTVGQFDPGGIGGVNATQDGFEARSRVNPWDFVLMIEGTMLFAGSVARRLGANAMQRAVFPFTVESVAVGYGSATASEETTDGSRAELWLPLWDRPASLLEVKHLFAEGRAQFGRRQVRNAVEFALAASLLGVSRGLTAFVRFGFLKRNGLAFLATPLGRVSVTPRPVARLLADPQLIGWLDRLRSACRDKGKTPARFQIALRLIDRAMYEFGVRGKSSSSADRRGLVAVLCALGRAERTLARGLKFCESNHVRPLQGLSPQWIDQADDDSREFRLAISLAGIRGQGTVGPFRMFLEPVEPDGRFFNWPKNKNRSAVWSNRSLAANLAAIFRRRQMEVFRDAKDGSSARSHRPARLADVIAFLHSETDDHRIADLCWALTAIAWPELGDGEAPESSGEPYVLPFEFGVPRLLVEPRAIDAVGGRWKLTPGEEPNIKPDPRVFDILASGQSDAVERCVDSAARRLKSGGQIIHGYRNRRQAGRPLAFRSPVAAERLLAAMLFPLSNHSMETVANAVLYKPETPD